MQTLINNLAAARAAYDSGCKSFWESFRKATDKVAFLKQHGYSLIEKCLFTISNGYMRSQRISLTSDLGYPVICVAFASYVKPHQLPNWFQFGFQIDLSNTHIAWDFIPQMPPNQYYDDYTDATYLSATVDGDKILAEFRNLFS